MKRISHCYAGKFFDALEPSLPPCPARETDSGQEREPSAADNPVMKRSVIWTGVTLAAFLLVEALCFRLPWYYQYLQPESSAGAVELREYWIHRFHPAQAGEVLVVGDSRIAEGFSARQAAQLLANQQIYFWNCGIPGSSPRVWYYILRDADPGRDRFRAIVLALDHFSDEDSFDTAPDRLIDLNFVIGRLRWSDVWDFASSMRRPARQQAAFVGAILKGSVLRSDVQEFLADIPRRRKLAADFRAHGNEYVLGYGGRAGNLEGLSADWKARKLSFPPALELERRNSIQYELMPDLPPQTGELTAYRMRWLGRIIDLYRKSATRIVFIEMPRGPLLQPPGKIPATFIDWARKQPHVVVVDASTFRGLETPQTFFDGLHLNREGREKFTSLFAARMGDVLANP